MPIPLLKDLITPSSTAFSLPTQTIPERLLTSLAMLATGKSPDGTSLPGGNVPTTRAAGAPHYAAPATTAAATWVTVGDIAIVAGASFAASADTITAISSTKVSGWTQVIDGTDATNNQAISLWFGTVTATGADTLALTWTAVPGAGEVAIDEWTNPLGTGTWHIVNSGSLLAPSSPWSYPNLTSGTTRVQLYWGYQQGQGSPSGGAGAGFTFTTTSDGNYIAANGTLANTTAFHPTSLGFTSAVFSVAGIFQVQ